MLQFTSNGSKQGYFFAQLFSGIVNEVIALRVMHSMAPFGEYECMDIGLL